MATRSQIAQDSYHDTISKMARKYSQYQLPSASDLVESDEEADDIKMEDEDEDEEDEDILSDTQTMLSHRSLSSKPSVLLRKSSSPSRSRTKVHFGTRSISASHLNVSMNPMEEILEIQMDKSYFIDIFDKYFDESKEGDVDLSEFKKGLHKLGVTDISSDQMSKLFNVLLIAGDGDNESGYLQSEQFSDFLTRRFEAPQLIAFQDLLLNIIINKTKKNSSRHRLMSADDAEQWDAAEVSLAEIEMRQAMEQMVDNEMSKINRNQEFAEELERRMADPSFCLDSNASCWSKYEVCHWVSSNGYEYAQRRFFDLEIDGNVLLYDVNITMLINQLGIASIHSNKFMRNLNELRDKISLNISYDYCVNDYFIESKSNETKEKLDKSQKEIVGLKVDYESMKSSYDLICKELNESKLRVNSLRKMNDSLSDENAQLKYNPYLNNDHKDKDDAYSFLDEMILNDDALQWESQEVAYWLTTIGMKKYLAQFMEQFIDGQILLNDLNISNLISDLEVKSLHAPKIMREINKLKRNNNHLEIDDSINNYNIKSMQNQLIEELKTQTATLKDDLSSTRMKLSNLRIQIDEYKNHSPQSSIYSAGNQSDATTMTAITVKSYRPTHLRTESSVTQKSAYSEGDIEQSPYRSPTPPLPQDRLSRNWQKYISHLESKNRELSTLFLRADNNLKKYSKAIIPFQERINNLELQNQTRKKSIDKLNKRIDRRNETIKKLKRHQQSLLNNNNINNPLSLSPSTSSISSSTSNNAQMQLTQEQETYFNNAQKHYKNYSIKSHKYANSDLLYKKKLKRNRKIKTKNIILTNDPLNNGVNGYISTGSAVSIQSAPPSAPQNDDDNSIIGSLTGITSMAYGYIMGSPTPRNY